MLWGLRQPKRTKQDDEFCDRVKALRAKMGITLDEMAKMLGVTRWAVSMWERKKRAPTRRTKLRGQIRFRIIELEKLAERVSTEDRAEPVSFHLPKKKKNEDPIRVG